MGMERNDLHLPGGLGRRYEALRLLGQGGSGRVVAARDRVWGRHVALKLLRPDRLREQGRLREEFEILSALEHPGVLRVHTFGVADGVVFLASDLLRGPRLDRWLERVLEEPGGAARVEQALADVLATLAWMHAEQIVHGDLKPANIVLRDAGRQVWPVLIDFGFATLRDRAAMRGGTAAYMAPELFAGWTPSPATDIYALGHCLLPWVKAGLLRGELAAVVKALADPDWEKRPTAAEALNALGRRVERRQVLGMRDAAGLFAEPLRWVGRTLDLGAGGRGKVLRLELPSAEDGRRVAGLLAARLELQGRATLLVDEEASRGTPVALWERVCDVVGRPLAAERRGRESLAPVSAGDTGARDRVAAKAATSSERGEPIGRLAPSESDALAESPVAVLDRKVALEALAIEVIEALREETETVLIASGVGAWDEAPRYVLRRVIEAGIGADVVLVDSGGGAGPGEPRLEIEGIEPAEVLGRCGVAGAAPKAAEAWLRAAGREGSSQVRRLLEAWVAQGVLRPEGGGWRWGEVAPPEGGVELEGVWERVAGTLTGEARGILRDLGRLGGVARVQELAELRGEGLRGELDRLVARGWVQSGSELVRLPGAIGARLQTGLLGGEASEDETRRYLEVASPEVAERGRLEALGRLQLRLGAPREAAGLYERVLEGRDRVYDLPGGGEAALQAARAWWAAGQPLRALDRAEDAAQRLEAAGDRSGVEAALALAERTAEALERPEDRARAVMARARAAVHTGRPEEALEASDEVEALLGGQGMAQELAIARGTAADQLGRTEESRRLLERAVDLAEEAGDLHATGRIANNLGNVCLQRGELEAAAAFYRRSAAAKVRLGEARGRRIAESNLALALRLSGRLSEAMEVAEGARTLAAKIGDRRGEAAGTLGLALMRLDLGEIDAAEEELRRFDGLPRTSEVVRLDGRAAWGRVALARGRFEDAKAQLLGVHEAGVEARIAAVTRESWGLAYGACVLGGLEAPRDALARTESLWESAQADVGGAEGMLVGATRVHLLAIAGRWGAAREGLKQLSGHAVPPGADLTLVLARQAAELVGGDVDIEGWAARERALVARRLEARRVLGLEALSEARLRQVLGLTSTPAAPGETASEPEPALEVGRRLGPAPGGAAGDAGQFLESLMGWCGARSAALLVKGDEGGVVAAAGEPVAEGRFGLVLRGLAGRFEAKDATGALEALVVPTGAAGGLALAWEPARSLVVEELVAGLEGALPTLELMADRERLARANRALEARVSEVAAQTEHAEEEISILKEALSASQSEAELRFGYERIVHRSRGMKRVLRTLDRVTETDLPVLITGESGVGKELLARALHFNGSRRGAALIAENMGAVPSDLFESVLFGHVRGAFTGAQAAQVGLVRAAEGGTLFLDEIGELGLDQQVKLLRVLEERRVRPVGSTREHAVDFRLVAATNKDLRAMVAEGRFREDLYYRVAVVTVEVPPLRERVDDVLPLAEHFVAAQGRRLGRPTRLSDAARAALVAYEWPGNVRELENEMLRASVLAEAGEITPWHLSRRVRAGESAPVARGAPRERATRAEEAGAWDGETSLKAMVEALEKRVIEDALRAHGGKKVAVAGALGLSRPGLDAKIRRLGIDVSEFKGRSS